MGSTALPPFPTAVWAAREMYCAERPERNGADGGGYQKGGGEKAGKKEEREKIETQEASQAVGTLPFSASLTSWLSCSNISS